MKMLSRVRSKIENWLINDTLNSSNYTNINEDAQHFIDTFGINQLCLLEMFDNQTKCFYGSDVAGFGFLLSTKSYQEDQFQTLVDIPHKLKRGFGVQITSIKQTIIVSVSCNVAFTNKEGVKKMLEAQEELCKHLKSAFEIELLTAEDLININSQILYPNRLIGSQQDRLKYHDVFFVRDQLAQEEVEIQSCKDKLIYSMFDDSYSLSCFGIRQYFAQELLVNIKDYEKFIHDHPNIFENTIVTLGIYKPLEKKRPKNISAYEHRYQQKLQVYHLIIKANQNVSDDCLIDVMRSLDFKVSLVSNRQLASLFFSLPIGLGEAMISDIYDLRLCKSVDSLHYHDLIPVLYDKMVTENEAIQTI